MQTDLPEEREQIGDRIDVWTASLDREEETYARLESALSPDEIARANRFHFAKDRKRYVVARGLLRKILGRYLRQAPAALEFSYGAYGKPALLGAHVSSGLTFNLAHSGELAAYAVSTKRNLGIDVELIKPESAGEDIARRYFSGREVSDLLTLPPEQRVAAFFRCWTRKEAYLKATGMGLQTPLDSFSVSLLPGVPAQFLGGVDPCWHMAAFNPGDNYSGALAYDGTPSRVRYFDVDSEADPQGES